MDLDDIMEGAGWDGLDLLDVLVDFLHCSGQYQEACGHAMKVAYQERLWHDK